MFNRPVCYCYVSRVVISCRDRPVYSVLVCHWVCMSIKLRQTDCRLRSTFRSNVTQTAIRSAVFLSNCCRSVNMSDCASRAFSVSRLHKVYLSVMLWVYHQVGLCAGGLKCLLDASYAHSSIHALSAIRWPFSY